MRHTFLRYNYYGHYKFLELKSRDLSLLDIEDIKTITCFCVGDMDLYYPMSSTEEFGREFADSAYNVVKIIVGQMFTKEELRNINLSSSGFQHVKRILFTCEVADCPTHYGAVKTIDGRWEFINSRTKCILHLGELKKLGVV